MQQDVARLMYPRVYFASGSVICLREDQLLVVTAFHEGRDATHLSRTNSRQTMQIVVAALMNPASVVLMCSL
ncbi:hypothetical protein BC834DRAFT_345937 [Gloeopeniophorella convolvens]|nr:hypothetical protein BC834DRAFT_345937 [Gloeopeniophorella convolvens]